MTKEASTNRRARALRQRQHRQLLKEQRVANAGRAGQGDDPSSTTTGTGAGMAAVGEVRQDVCWDWVKSGGQCYRGASCRYKHEAAPLTAIPVSRRFLVAEDTFPESREADPVKAEVNATILRLSAELPNRRAMVLDGAGCESARALQRECPGAASERTRTRTAEDVVVPNAVSETFRRIKALQLCEAFHGSLRLYMDSNPTQRFGAIYLDYCWCAAQRCASHASVVCALCLLTPLMVADGCVDGGCAAGCTHTVLHTAACMPVSFRWRCHRLPTCALCSATE